MRRGAAVLLAMTVLALAPAADAGGGPYQYGGGRTTSRCGLNSDSPSPSECDPTFTTDTKQGRFRGDVSISTPGGGTLPGWGGASGFGELLTTRQVTKPAKAVTFVVRLKVDVKMKNAVQVGAGAGYVGFHTEAIHQDCFSACEVEREGAEFSRPFRGYVDLPFTITSPRGLVPAGDVVIWIGAGASSELCCMGVRGYYAPPFVFPSGPPAIGSFGLRLNAVVRSLKRL